MNIYVCTLSIRYIRYNHNILHGIALSQRQPEFIMADREFLYNIHHRMSREILQRKKSRELMTYRESRPPGSNKGFTSIASLYSATFG